MSFPAIDDGLSPLPSHTARPPFRLRKVSPSIPEMSAPRKFKVLIAANGVTGLTQAMSLQSRLGNHPHIETRLLLDVVTSHGQTSNKEGTEYDAYELCVWADLLALVPIDARTMAMMLNGMIHDTLSEVLREWDVTKKMILVPGMTDLMWENPMTRKQLHEIRSKWNWIRVMPPILWKYTPQKISRNRVVAEWTGEEEIVEMIQNQADLNTIGHDVDCTTSGTQLQRSQKSDTRLPPEIWSTIFQYVGDWETAVRLRVWTNLPIPEEWKNSRNIEEKDPIQSYLRLLEWTLLRQPVSDALSLLSKAPDNLKYITSLSVKLVVKFGLTPVLSYLELNQKDVFWTSFGSKLLPTLASAIYGRPDILEWWRTAPSFLKKDYTVEAMDGASKSGFVHVLDWWHKSGLPLKYTEAALEQASAKGHILVLEWFRNASMHQGNYFIDSNVTSNVRMLETADHHAATHTPSQVAPLRLKVGKSIIAAAQHGQVATVTWWDTSRIPYSHSESVCKTASAYGHVAVLEEWKRLKGEKFAMAFDNTVLIGPTKSGFVDVLEWWKDQTLERGISKGVQNERRMSEGASGGLVGGDGENGTKSRLKVEYKTCDIEEALEDCVGNEEGVAEVRRWWARNGLNLGVGTSEWMQIKSL